MWVEWQYPSTNTANTEEAYNAINESMEEQPQEQFKVNNYNDYMEHDDVPQNATSSFQQQHHQQQHHHSYWTFQI